MNEPLCTFLLACALASTPAFAADPAAPAKGPANPEAAKAAARTDAAKAAAIRPDVAKPAAMAPAAAKADSARAEGAKPSAAVARTNAAKPGATPSAKGDPRSAAGPVKVMGSQQNRMRECNKSATGMKGDERRAFMKSCLSTRKS
jgi:hypothetical protein